MSKKPLCICLVLLVIAAMLAGCAPKPEAAAPEVEEAAAPECARKVVNLINGVQGRQILL